MTDRYELEVTRGMLALGVKRFKVNGPESIEVEFHDQAIALALAPPPRVPEAGKVARAREQDEAAQEGELVDLELASA